MADKNGWGITYQPQGATHTSKWSTVCLLKDVAITSFLWICLENDISPFTSCRTSPSFGWFNLVQYIPLGLSLYSAGYSASVFCSLSNQEPSFHNGNIHSHRDVFATTGTLPVSTTLVVVVVLVIVFAMEGNKSIDHVISVHIEIFLPLCYTLGCLESKLWYISFFHKNKRIAWLQ